MRTTRRTAVLLALVATCLLAVTACSVPGGYTVATLNKQPEAALTYPGSTDVQPRHSDGIRGNWASKGGPAYVGLTAATTASPAAVIAYYSTALTSASWTQTLDEPTDTLAPGRVSHVVAWQEAKLSYMLNVWITDAATQYSTTLSAL